MDGERLRDYNDEYEEWLEKRPGLIREQNHLGFFKWLEERIGVAVKAVEKAAATKAQEIELDNSFFDLLDKMVINNTNFEPIINNALSAFFIRRRVGMGRVVQLIKWNNTAKGWINKAYE